MPDRQRPQRQGRGRGDRPEAAVPEGRGEPTRADEPRVAPRARRLPPVSSRERLLQVLLLVAGLALAGLALVQHRDLGEARGELLALLERPEMAELGEPVAVLARRIARESDLDRSRLALARLLVSAELGLADEAGEETAGADTVAAPPAAGADEAAALSLSLPRRLAAEVARRRPASAEASTLLGAATYLGWRRERDRRLFTEATRWERPLDHARSLAPGRGDAAAFLATAYLELWPALSPAKREAARELLVEAFAERRFFGLLLRSWLDIARDSEEAFGAVPETAWAWASVARVLAEQRNWEGYLAATRRQRALLAEETEANLAEARELVRRGELASAREKYLGTLASLPPDAGALPVARQVLAEAPAGAATRGRADAFAAWLDWTLERCRRGSCPLPPASIRRLVGLAGEPPPPVAAEAALFADRPERAERLERRAERTDTRAWIPYLQSKAHWHLDRGEREEALAALARLHPAGRDDPSYWRARLRAARELGDTAAAAAARDRLREGAARRWPAAAWYAERPRWRLDVVVEHPAGDRLVIELAVPPPGGVVELFVDGRGTGLFAVEGTRRIEVALAGSDDGPGAAGTDPIAGRPVTRHRVELVHRAGAVPSPGEVSLSPASEERLRPSGSG